MKKKIGFYDYTVILTYLGFALAFAGILNTMNERHWDAILCLIMAGVCDMFDGAVAATKKRSPQEKRFGIQIDSLSDLVSFGILPAVFVYKFSDGESLVGVLCMVYALCALIRLAYYNVLEEQRQNAEDGERNSYLGLPVTVIALLLPAAFLLYDEQIIKSRMIFYALIAIVGAAFISPFEVRKPKIIGKIILLIVAAIEAIALTALALWGSV